ncbi:hypothetical protein BJ508DRAFT_182597 [Ascobolus immersus RN42]|uniref:Uncharacterized protein n=1 Tax=Ascobolus immersus RN42 TaxID=1160509 RepID=A0A3N4HVR4_ASCIM|nr:hypothetical protein BJ508DRAFT_182597 [Ascobolus immersus RN42]
MNPQMIPIVLIPSLTLIRIPSLIPVLATRMTRKTLIVLLTPNPKLKGQARMTLVPRNHQAKILIMRRPAKARMRRSRRRSRSPSSQVRPDSAATNDALREAKSTSPPHTGNSKTRYRNARKKKRQQLIRLIQQGLLPTGSTLAILNAVQKLVNPSRTIKEACQIYLAEKDGAADGNSAMHLSEEAANGSPSIDSQSFIERQRQPDYSRSNSVLEESQPVTASGPPQKGKVAQKQSNVAEKSFIMANAKYATNKKKGFLQKMKGRERSYQKYDDDGNPIDVQDCNPTPTEDSHFDETAGSGDHWKGKITLSAVEVGQGYEEMIPAPSFPFQHPYLQMKGKKGKKGKKQNRPQQQQEYYDESMYDDSYYAEEAYQEDTQTQTEPEPAVEDLPSLPTDISSLPELTEDNVKEGMVICYKIMEISKSYQPIVSDYRTALVNSIFPDCRGFPEYLGVTLAKRDQPVQEIDPETGEPVRGKFELVDDELSGRAEEAPGYLELEFRDLIEPRILKEPELTPEQQAKFEKAVEWPDLDGRSGKGDENSPPSPPADSHAEGSDDPPTNSGSAQDDGNKDVDMDTNARTHCAEDSLGTGDDQVVHDVQDERESSDQEAANSEGSQNARLEQEVQSAQDAEVSAALADTQVHGLSPQEFGTEEAEGSLADAQLVQEAVERSIEPEAFCADREAAHHPEEANDADHIDGQIAAAESVSDQPVSKESDTQPGDAGKLESEVPVVEHVRVDEVAAEGSSNSQESDDVVIPDSLQQVPHEPNLLTSLSQVVDSQTTSALDPEKVADSQLDEHSRSASPVKIQQPEQTAVNVGDCTALGFDSDFPPSYQPPCSTNDTETSGAALLSDAYTSDLASAKQLSVSMESKETDSTIQADAAGATSEEDDSDVSMDDDEHHEGSQEGSPHSDADQMEVDDASEDENEELQERYADSDIDEDYVGSPVALSNDEAEDLGKAQERAETGLSVRETTPVPQVEERTAAMREAQVAPTEPTTTIASDSSFKIPATPGQDGVGPSLNKAAPSPRLDEVQILTPKELNTPEPTTHSTPPPSSQPVKTPTPKKTETPEVGDLKKGIAKAREVLTGFLSNQPGLLGDVITKGKENDKGSPTGSKNIDILGIRDSLIPGGIAKRKSLPASSPKRSPLKRRTLFDSPSPSRVLSPPKKNRPFKIHDDKENPFAEKQGSVPVRREQPSSSSQPVRTPNEQAHLSSSQPEPPKTSAKARGSSSRSSFISPTDLGEDFANFNNYIPRDSQPLSTLSKSRQSNANMAPSSSAPLTSELRKVKSERSSKSATPVPLPNRASTGKAVMIDLTQMNSDDDLEVDTEKKQDSFLGKGAEKKRTSIGGRPSWARPGQSSGQPKK